MEAKLQSVTEMQVVGIEIRTSNQNEMEPATAQIFESFRVPEQVDIHIAIK